MKSNLGALVIVLFYSINAKAGNDAMTSAKCDEIRRESGIIAYAKCVADIGGKTVKSFGKNYVPGGGGAPGMTMDEIQKKADEISDFCHTEGGLCDGKERGTVIGTCKC